MNIILDCYNLIKTSRQSLEVLNIKLQELINNLKKYKKIRGHNIILVIDGGDSFYEHTVFKDGIEIVYSGTRKTADDVILKISKNFPEQSVLVVSSDNDLCVDLSNRSIVTINSDVFLSILKERLSLNQHGQSKNKHQEAIKMQSDEDLEEYDGYDIDELMQNADVIDKDMHKTITMNKVKPLFDVKPKHKVDRKLLKIINKL